jgi:hypothetical protein
MKERMIQRMNELKGKESTRSTGSQTVLRMNPLHNIPTRDSGAVKLVEFDTQQAVAVRVNVDDYIRRRLDRLQDVTREPSLGRVDADLVVR